MSQSGYISKHDFINIVNTHNYNKASILEYIIKNLAPNYTMAALDKRLLAYKTKGLLALESGNKSETGLILKKVSRMYDKNGNVRVEWLSAEKDKTELLNAFKQAVKSLSEIIPALPLVPQTSTPTDLTDHCTVYISNDIHYGALMWDKESGNDWNVELAAETHRKAVDYLMSTSPSSKIAIVTDLGDLTEVNDSKNMTPKSGHILAVDSRYPKILRAAYEGLIYTIHKALEKHELVYFYNIAGNHDIDSAIAVREVIRMAFINNSRVIVDDSPSNIKYHQHGQTLLQFAHGDGLKMKDAGETMAHDCQSIFSSTSYRYAHFGHTHVDAVVDTKLCRAESHRNLAPNNHWAFNMGYRVGAGTMKSITYHTELGEISRNIFTVTR